MSPPPIEIAVHAWPLELVLERLGCPAPAGSLPAVSRCPACAAEALLTRADHLAGGTWSWCASCGVRGWPFDLAAAAWKVEPAEALSRLGAEGDLAGLEAATFAPRRTAEALWRAAEALPPDDSPRRAGLPGPRVEDREVWAKQLGRSVRWIARRPVNAALRPRTTAGAGPGRRGDPTDPIVLLPAWDLPGRIRGIYLAGWSQDPEAVPYRLVPVGRHDRVGALPGPLDAGLIGWQAAALAEPTQMVCVLDPALWLRIQARHLRQAGRPGAVVCALETPAYATRDSWAGLGLVNRGVVVWGADTPALYAQAAACSGLVSTAIPAGWTIEEALSQRLVARLLDRARRKALPWRDALEEKLAALPSAGELERFLLAMRLDDDTLDAFETGCARDVRIRLRAARGVMEPATAGGVVERGGRWLSRGKVVCDTLARLERLIWYPGCDAEYYEGRLVQDEREHRFVCPVASVDAADDDEWLRSLARAAGVRPPEVSKGWALKLGAAARALHPPRVVRGALGPGWCGPAGAFAFSRYAVRLGGEVLGPEAIPLLPGLMGCGPPPPGISELSSLLERDAAPAWVAAAIALHAALSYAVLRAPAGVLLAGGPDADDGWPGLFAALGCVDEGRIGLEEPAEFRWPVLSSRRRGPAGEQPARCRIVRLAPSEAAAAHAAGGLLLEGDTPIEPGHAAAIAPVASAWLVDACRRRLALRRGAATPADVLCDLAAWAASRAGRAPAGIGPALSILGAAADRNRSAAGLLDAALTRLGLDLAAPAVRVEAAAVLEAARALAPGLPASRWSALLRATGVVEPAPAGDAWIVRASALPGPR